MCLLIFKKMEFYLCCLFLCLLCFLLLKFCVSLFCRTVLAVARILKPVKENCNMDVMQSLVGRLRPLVGLKAWDYCVIWELSEDQRFVRWVDCCCAGTDQICIRNNEVEDIYFSTAPSCRDLMVQHPRTNSCELLAQLPSLISLDSGIHAEAVVSNQSSWLNFSSSSDCLNLEDTISTKVLIPLPGGLVELFAAKQVPGDKNVIDFVTAQCNVHIGQDGITDRFSGFMDCMVGAEPGKGFDQKSQTDMFMKHEVSADQTGQYNPQMVMNPFNMSEEVELREMVNGMGGGNGHHLDEDGEHQGNHEKEPFTHENGRSDSISYCSELNDDLEDDAKYGRKPRKGLPSKNLEAERKRRKKLNERLYTLRSLVPNISKLDRASILGDAIDYIKELLTQVKELQDELEENLGIDDGSNRNNGISQNGVLSNNNIDHRNGLEAGAAYNGKLGNQTMNQENPDDKVQEMEPQVEIALDGKECYVKVICEHKPRGFTRLMEALDSQGLEVTNVNVTRFLSLVSNVFKVERKDNELVQAVQVRDSLLEITRNTSSRWHDDPTTSAATESNKKSINYHHHCNGHC